MRGLLVRVGADQSDKGGGFNGPVDSRTGEFTYVPIPEDQESRLDMKKPYAENMLVSNAISKLDISVSQPNMHLDPDFEHLTYGDERCKGCRIYTMWKESDGLDFLVFYAGLCDVNPDNEHLVYAIVGFYMIDEVIQATDVSPSRYDENAHTRRAQPREDEIVVRATRGESGRLERCMPIGCHRTHCDKPHGHLSYRVIPDFLTIWGGLLISDGFLQRSAYLPEFKDAERFLKWFRKHRPKLIAQNN